MVPGTRLERTTQTIGRLEEVRTMGTRTTVAAALVAATGVLTLYGSVLGQTGTTPRTPTQSDFDLCNREAQTASGGSAAPRMGAAPSPGPATSGSSAAGATGGTGSLSGGSTLSSGASGTAGDPALPGIASGSGSDPAYQQAYRDCLRRRGF
jgi:hypothetical protein